MKPTILNQRYRLFDLVGAGGMATVYRGEDLLLERTVAIKFLREPYASDPIFRERFLGEARAAARLDHPGIVRIYDVGQDEGNHPYIVMEIVEGEDLKTLIRRNGPLPVAQALNLTRQISAGVGHAHRAGIVHCDLKPQNILVTQKGETKVADFGIARAFRREDGTAQQQDDVVWGSPHYISPEQVRGEHPTPASDVYSIGVIMYEMLTGVPPFHDPDPAVLAMKHLREEPVPLRSLNPRVPPGLEALVRRALAKNPADRFQNADQLAIAINAYMQQGESHTRPQDAIAPAVIDSLRTPPPPTVAAAISEPISHTQPVTVSEGLDFMLWALIGVAAIAVIGLIPLWIFVYQNYTQPASIPTTHVATVTPTSAVAEAVVSVPNLTGLSAPDAQRLAEDLGLHVEVLGEQESTDARPGAILEQTPGPGNRVPVDTTISVVLAAGRPLTLQDVVGYNINDDNVRVQEGLEAEGLLIHVEKVWSTELEGLILEQDPAVGTLVRAGDTITLTVSGGTSLPIPLEVNLNNQIMLEDARVSQLHYRPGDSVAVTLRWRSIQSTDKSYKVFVHLLTPDMQTLIAQRDIEPMNGLRPTNTWTPGEIINDPHQVLLPENTPAGTYQIRVGLYDPAGRLSVVDPGQAQVLDDTIFITTFEVQR